MQYKLIRLIGTLIVAFTLACAVLLRAEDPTSKFMPLAPLASSLPATSTGNLVQFEVWDQASAGSVTFTEVHTVDTDAGSNITNDTGFADLLLGRPGGLVSGNFPAGSSRYLDVTQGGISVLTARVPLYAAAFTISAPNEIPGNLTLVNSTATAGNITKGGFTFLHDFGGQTFLGTRAGNLTMSGGNNTGIGLQALRNNTSGSRNTAVGVNALNGNSTGADNTANGYQTLLNNTTGGSNTASGAYALFSNTDGCCNTAIGNEALKNNTGSINTAIGFNALINNTTGFRNTATGKDALWGNTTGSGNTAIGENADVAPGMGNLTNATAIGYNAEVNASNKIRLGNGAVTVIEGQVPYTFISDKSQKENFQPVEGEQVLRKISGLSLTSWNYIGHDPKQFRHYGPVAQEFFGAFGHDGVGTIGTSTTINSGDMEGILMVAVQALEKRTTELQQEKERLKSENAHLAALTRQQQQHINTEAIQIARLKQDQLHLKAKAAQITELQHKVAALSATLKRLERQELASAARPSLPAR